ncbi:Down syndrome cell adhesion molecule-like protein Dscam2 [Myzus persicae]|uniref:Down syndrome cell adhesion molecule-like protein Dscam2 n=1 Tax=Myzus persicae TaxID=13164 RepID=UPI000B939509|nr:Down syndrome cell adhesion molecule-like protein Dscam2 [Myzus persicae]
MAISWICLIIINAFIQDIVLGIWQTSPMEPPNFIVEPPSLIYFSNTTGTLINCQGQGNPQPNVTWLLHNDRVVTDIPSLREMRPNGNLYFPPFPEQSYMPEIHAATYKCALENPVGRIVSRESRIKAVMSKSYELSVQNAFALQGNVAEFKCQLPELTSEHLVKTWFKMEDSRMEVGQSTPIHPGGRYVISLDGTLLIHDVVPEDTFDRYFCQVVNKYTGDQLVSQSAKIVVKQPTEDMAPIIKHHTEHIHVKVNQEADLICSAEGFPPPTYRWFRKSQDNLQEISMESLTVHPYQSLLHIIRVPMSDSAITYECVVSNKLGQDKRQISLSATLPFAVSAYPLKQVVDSGSTAVFNCTTQGTSIQPLFSWLKDGSPIRGFGRHEISQKGNHLTIHNVMKEDKGIYQCLARDPETDETAQSSVLLLLGAVSPELMETFHEQITRINGFLSLRCTASGNPPPRIYWYLDGGLILPQGDYVFGSYMHVDGNVVSYLNVSVADVLHGGYYTCLARNILGLKSHSAMVKIYGDPIARPPSNLTVRSEDDAYLQCPVAGYPIIRTAWQKDMITIPNNPRHTLFDNGTLFIRSTQDTVDSGLYVCTKITDRGQSATGHLYLRIMKPPVVTPFQFTKDLQESERAQVSCTIKSGDLPMEFVWRKDNRIVLTDSEIELQNFKFSSTLLFSNLKPKHAGIYTCIVSNSVASSNYSALLNIKVPPKWIVEPEDTSVLDNQLTIINCQAEGYPEPRITWTRVSDNQLLQSLNHFSESAISILGNGSLAIRVTANSNEDNYTCTANNGIGNQLTKTVSLKVHIPAHFKEKSINKSGVVGSRVVLTCEAEGSKPLNIEWSPSVENINTRNTNKGIISELHLSSLHSSQTGIYTCMATNSYGYDHMTINLVVREPPESPKQLDVVDAGTRWLEFRWDSVKAHVTHYVLQMCINLCSDWSNYTIGGSLSYTKISYLKPATQYTTRVIAVNDFGSSNPSPNNTVTTLEDEPSAPPNNVEAIDIDTHQVTIRWKPPDKDTWNGQITCYKVSYADVNEITEVFTKTTLGYERCEIRITNLKPFTTYRIAVKAFNSVGPGPDSDFIRITTNEGVPEEPPQNVQCSPLTAESLRMSWDPPPIQSHHGTILGYKIHYKKVNPKSGSFVLNEMKKTTNLETNLHALDKYTNYSVRILAYTKVGEGVQSNPVYCLTEQDVPGPPDNVKALTVTSSSILVSWMQPKHPNGVIIKYTVYVKHNKIVEKEIVFGDKSTKIEVRRLKEFQRYEFWVTASTVVGEGQPSFRVNQSPNSRAPARVASFGEHVNTVVGSTCMIECYKVGMPTPGIVWKKPDDIETKVLSDGSLSVGPVVDKTYSGNYTCHVENIFGRDQISYTVNVLYPPLPPEFSVDPVSTSAIRVQWKPVKQPDAVTTAYVLNYHTGNDQQQSVDVDSDRFAYTVERLKCGTKYAITMQTVNTVGMSNVGRVVEVFTKGGVPKEPDKDTVLSVNSTSVTLTFGSWPTQMCSIHSFTCQYAANGRGGGWVKFPRQKLIGGDTFTIGQLQPATVYTVRVVVHTEAGDTQWEHRFATRTKTGGIVSLDLYGDEGGFDDEDELGIPSFAQMHKYVPAASALVCVVSFCVCICVVVQRRKKDGAQYSQRRRASSAAGRKCSYEADKQVEYATSTLQRSKRDDSADKMFMGGGGGGGKSIDYDVCPYATFSVMQTTPSGSRTPAHHRALSQTDCYETPDHVVHGLPIDKSYEISYISNQQTLPLTSAKSSVSRKAMTPVHFLTDMDDEQCRKMMASNTVRKQSSESRGARRHYN